VECVFQTQSGPTLNALCFTSDRKRIAAGGAEHVVRVYDIEEGVEAIRLSTDGHALGEGVSVPGRLSGHSLKIVSLRADHTNPHLMFSAGIDRKILCWDLRSGYDAVGQIHGPQLCGDAMDISRDGHTLLTGSHRADKPLQLFDLRRLSTPFSTLAEASASYSWRGDEPILDPRSKPASCLLFGVAWDSATNTTIAAAGQHENVAKAFARRDDVSQPLHTVGRVENDAGGFWSVAVAADGSRVAFGAVDGGVHLAHLPAGYRGGGRTGYVQEQVGSP